MNYWYEYVLAFLLGLVGCVVAARILNCLLPLN
jgi:hypothetical protein